MSIRKQLINEAINDPVGLRTALKDRNVAATLEKIGVLPKILELHAPSPNARKAKGVGATLCGIRGTLHPIVTCKRCLLKQTRDGLFKNHPDYRTDKRKSQRESATAVQGGLPTLGRRHR